MTNGHVIPREWIAKKCDMCGQAASHKATEIDVVNCRNGLPEIFLCCKHFELMFGAPCSAKEMKPLKLHGHTAQVLLYIMDNPGCSKRQAIAAIQRKKRVPWSRLEMGYYEPVDRAVRNGWIVGRRIAGTYQLKIAPALLADQDAMVKLAAAKLKQSMKVGC